MQQECPCCLEVFDEEELVVPPCDVVSHSACEECTQLWWKKQQKESCVVCRGQKKYFNVLNLLHWFLLSCSFTFLYAAIIYSSIVLYDLVVLHVHIVYFIIYHKYCDIVPTKTTWRVFFIGFVVAILCVGASFVCLTYNMRLIMFYVLQLSICFGISMHIVCFLRYLHDQQVSFVIIRCLQTAIAIVLLHGYIQQLQYVYKTYLTYK